METCEVFDFNK